MANIKSQIKRIRTNNKAQDRNRAYRSALRTAIRKFREAVVAGDAAKNRDRTLGSNPGTFQPCGARGIRDGTPAADSQ